MPGAPSTVNTGAPTTMPGAPSAVNPGATTTMPAAVPTTMPAAVPTTMPAAAPRPRQPALTQEELEELGLTPEEFEEIRQSLQGADPLTIPIPQRRNRGRPRGRDNTIMFCPFAAEGRVIPCVTYQQGTTKKKVRSLPSYYSY